MRKIIKRLFQLLFLTFVVIQFFRPERNLSAKNDKHINTLFNIPADVSITLQNACYDCHSNKTNYPWYSHIQPIGWWLAHHVDEGKAELNFSEFASYRLRRQYHKMEEVIEMVEEEEMPLFSYTIMHGNASLNDEQRKGLTLWAKTVMDSLKARYPMDSLVRKK